MIGVEIGLGAAGPLCLGGGILTGMIVLSDFFKEGLESVDILA